MMPNDPLMILLLTNNVWSVGQFKINWQKAALGLVFGKLELFSCKIGSKKNIARFAIGLTFLSIMNFKNPNDKQYAIEKRKKTNIQNMFYKMYRNANIIICAWTYIWISWSVSCSLGGLFVFVFMLFVFVFAFAFCWSVSGNYAAGGWPVNHLGVSVSTQQMNPNYSTPKSCMRMATAQRV